ncbi:MAG: sporulation initiation factor Spo0A C-terminal domain-containing protein [Oscillospiraceae bacterium]|nr:sporulation initiation factor Spo0A C-terminal domain-containing protein [Oscillospiraceae bacterium]
MEEAHYYLSGVSEKGEIVSISGTTAEIRKFIERDRERESVPELSRYLFGLFTEFGIPASLMGYRYLESAVNLVLTEPEYLQRKVTSELYPKIAEEFNTSPNCVERAIRHAITVAWDRGNSKKLYEFFGHSISSKTGKVTNSDFIAGIVEKVKIEHIV